MITKRVLLDADKSLGYGYLLKCCDKHQPIPIDAMEDSEYWCCTDCHKPLIINLNGQYYLIGENVTI